jgi:hypothetical protein
MTIAEEVARLRRQAAELVEGAGRRDRPLSPEEDAEILALLQKAQELELREKEDTKGQARV